MKYITFLLFLAFLISCNNYSSQDIRGLWRTNEIEYYPNGKGKEYTELLIGDSGIFNCNSVHGCLYARKYEITNDSIYEYEVITRLENDSFHPTGVYRAKPERKLFIKKIKKNKLQLVYPDSSTINFTRILSAASSKSIYLERDGFLTKFYDRYYLHHKD
jgi:hypothetical protein